METLWWLTYNKIPLLTEQTYAAEKKALAKVKWNYNEKILKVSTGWTEYILAIPAIINSNLQHTDIQTIIDNKELVYNNYSNLPDSYKNLWYTMTWLFDYSPTNIIVFSWSEITLEEDTDKLLFLNNLKNAYNWTIIQNEEIYKDIINSNTDTNEKWAIILVNNYIQNNVWWIEWKLSTVTYNNCNLDWKVINHWQTIPAFSESSILYDASYGCNEISQDRTCNDWKLSWGETYIYVNCIKWPPTNCSASWSYLYNSHTYSIPEIIHGQIATNITGTNVLENNGTFRYTLTSIECNNWTLINENESGANLVSCNLNYSESGNLCIADTQSVSCTWKPTGAVYNTATDITQTWNWNSWLPSIEATYNTDSSTSECRFKCDTNYGRNWSTCLEKINWVCWSSNWQNLTEEPTTWLCSSWDASTVTGSWPWTWTCNWINLWTSQNCTAWREKINLADYRTSMTVTWFNTDLTNLYDTDTNSSIIRTVPYIAQTKPSCWFLFPTVSAAQAAVWQIVIDMWTSYSSKTWSFIISWILTESNWSSTKYSIDHEPGVYCTETPVSPRLASYWNFKVYNSIDNVNWINKAWVQVSSDTVANKQKIFTLTWSITWRYIKLDVTRWKINNSIRIPQIDIELKDLQIFYDLF